MDTQGIEQMLSVLRSTAAQASGKPAESAGPGDIIAVAGNKLVTAYQDVMNIQV